MDPLESLRQLARTLPNQAGLDLALDIQALEGERQAHAALARTSERIAEMRDAFDLSRLLEGVLEEALSLVGGERGVLAVLERGTNAIRIAASLGTDRLGPHHGTSSRPERPQRVRMENAAAITVSRSLLERVALAGESVITTNIQEDPAIDLSASIMALEIRSVLAVPLRARERVVGALYVDTQINEQTFSEAQQRLLATFAAQAGVAVAFVHALETEREQYVGLLRTMLAALDERDPYTAGHSSRVGEYTARLGLELGWNAEAIERARFAGWVHDIGKIGIRDQFLFKPSPLTPEERLVLEEHPAIGERILRAATHGFEPILPAVRSHHERWDGSGYPDQLANTEIPLLARMISLSDTFDAMTTGRPYSAGKPWEAAFIVLRNEAGKQFDPDLVEPFIRVMEREGKVAETSRVGTVS